MSLLVGGVLSCRKTSKGKMTNEWTVSGFYSEGTSADGEVSFYESSTVLSGSLLKTTNSDSYFGTVINSERVSVVNEWTYTIDKDGSWSSFENTTRTRLDSTLN